MARKQPLSGKRTSTIKPDRARKLINKFHALNKKKSACEAQGDIVGCKAIDEELAKLGGIKTYQAASICGQSGVRGGDASKVLMEWLPQDFRGSLLEVGCLQVDNCCARSKQFDPHVRIDLNSQHPKIQEQDFMTMPAPSTPFSVISLSLVVNYVPDVPTRGQMLKKAHMFLENNGLLFLVLPRACIDNSRYCNAEIIHELFQGIGFQEVQTRKTTKLVYWLVAKQPPKKKKFTMPKRKVRDGPNMNNFSIVVE